MQTMQTRSGVQHCHAASAKAPRLACRLSRPICRQSVRAAAAHEETQQKAYYVAMNVFKVKPESATDFEEVWKSRQSHLKNMPGFVRFAMLKCDNVPGKYISQTYWESKEAFEGWTKSSQFQASHGGAKGGAAAGGAQQPNKRPSVMGMLEGPPSQEFFSTVTITE